MKGKKNKRGGGELSSKGVESEMSSKRSSPMARMLTAKAEKEEMKNKISQNWPNFAVAAKEEEIMEGDLEENPFINISPTYQQRRGFIEYEEPEKQKQKHKIYYEDDGTVMIMVENSGNIESKNFADFILENLSTEKIEEVLSRINSKKGGNIYKKSKKRSRKSKKRSRRSKKKLRRSEKNKKTKYTNKRNKKRIQKLRGGAQSHGVTWAEDIEEVMELGDNEAALRAQQRRELKERARAELENYEEVAKALKEVGLKNYREFFRKHFYYKLANIKAVKSISKEELQDMAKKEGWSKLHDWPTRLDQIIQALSQISDPISAEDAALASRARASRVTQAHALGAVSPEHLDRIREITQHVLILANDCEKYKEFDHCSKLEGVILSQLQDLGINPDDPGNLSEHEEVVRTLVNTYLEVKEKMMEKGVEK